MALRKIRCAQSKQNSTIPETSQEVFGPAA